MIDLHIQKILDGAKQTMNMDINLHINKGEFIVISGDSGSGKTTFLRCLAGLEQFSGYVKVSNTIWQDKNTILKIQKRNIGFVFQEESLFLNMTVLDNLLFVNNNKEFALKLLDIVNMTRLQNSMPSNLSGGQKQRISICRALMKKPDILLLDEPFSALDETVKIKLYKELLDFHNKFNLTTIMVSHDINEIYTLCSRHIEIQNAKVKKDENINDFINNKIANNNLEFKAKIIKLVNNEKYKIAIVNINNSFLNIKLHTNKNYEIGEYINIRSDKLSIC